MGGSNPPPGPLGQTHRARSWPDFLRKLAAIALVLSSVTVGIVGLGLATGGAWWGAALVAVTPIGIWIATRVTPEGGTTGYFDRNL